MDHGHPYKRNRSFLGDVWRSEQRRPAAYDYFNIGGTGNPDTAHFSVAGSALVRTSTLPVPAAVWLFGSGLIGLVGVSQTKEIITIKC